MSGTSMDAIDVALARFAGGAYLECYREYPLASSLRRELRDLSEHSPISVVSRLDERLGFLFAEAVRQLLQETGLASRDIVAIGSHGQTILHRPEGPYPASIQIGDPNVICNATGITTVADFRRMDMVNGGQGAPLAGAFHQYQFHRAGRPLIVLNIGGMANLTLLMGDEATGFDTGPGNALLNDWIQKYKQREYDKDGAWARQGRVNMGLLKTLLSDPYFSLPAPKSTGRDYFNLPWLGRRLDEYAAVSAAAVSAVDTQATLLRLSAVSIANAIKAHARAAAEVLVSGGGAFNRALLGDLQALLPGLKIVTTERYGLGPACVEAVAFAWLARQRMENKPANLPAVTGASRKAMLGGVYAPCQ